MKINVQKDREVIKDIIYKSLKLIRISKNKEAMCQNVADAIILHLIESERGNKK